MWKITSFFLISLVLSCSPSDTKTLKETRELIDQSVYSVNTYDGIKALEYAQKALKLSRSARHNESIVRSLCAVGEATAYLGMYKEALEYIEEAEKLCPSSLSDVRANIFFVKGWCYAYLGFTDKGLEAHYTAVKLLTSNKSKPVNLQVLLSTYQHIGVSYYEKENLDSIAKYEEKSAALISQLQYDASNANLFSTYYFNRSQNALDLDQPETSLRLLNEIYQIKKQANAKMYHIEYLGFASYYEYKKDYEKALEYYLKAVADIEHFNIAQIEMVEMYKLISDLYNKLGNAKLEKAYFATYIQKKDALQARNKKNIEYAISVILNDRLDEKAKSHSRTLVIVSGAAITIIFFLFLLYKTTQSKRKIVMKQLMERDETVVGLQQQVGDTFEELVQLTKHNDPQFWSRFQEIYPKFRKKLLALHPKMTVAELTMAAYHYLGFTTKDIARYTFKSYRTVESTRYRMRKKLAIDPEENFILWIRNYMDGA